jgi:hypothetical protein
VGSPTLPLGWTPSAHWPWGKKASSVDGGGFFNGCYGPLIFYVLIHARDEAQCPTSLFIDRLACAVYSSTAATR